MTSLESRVDRIEEAQGHQQSTLERIEEKVDRNAEKADHNTEKIDRNAEKIDQNGRRLDRAEGGSSQMSERITSLDNRINTLTLVVFGTGATMAGLMITILVRMG